MKKNFLFLLSIPLLVMSVASCGNKPVNPQDSGKPSDQSSESVEEPSYSISQVPDALDLIPEEVLNANVEIDLVEYIEGQNGKLPDIGNYSPDPNDKTRKYHPQDINYIEMAQYVGAAAAFKELAPNVKINLIYCSIGDYESLVREYNNQKGHLPHLMHSTVQTYENMSVGYNKDLSEYSDSEYYKQYNDFFMTRFNYGGFQGAFPFSAYPWGMFVNMDSLEQYNIVSDTINESTSECTDEYKNWVDNFTWEALVDASKKSNTDTHAGMSGMSESLLNYAVPSLYSQFISEGSVDLTSENVINDISKLLNYENELSQYCVYKYDTENLAGHMKAKDYFTNAHPWCGVENYVKDQYSTFFAEAPWTLPGLPQFIDAHNEKAETDSTLTPINVNIDFLPYPKMNADSPAYNGVGVSAMSVGNLCPVGEIDGLEHCYSNNAKLEMDVAAYFAMFMGLDPRSIKSRANMEYIYNGKTYKGSLSLPLSKRGSKFSWQGNPDYADIEDPAKDFDDNWQYQMSLWLNLYDLYKTNDEPADVEYFTNITYGLVKLFDSIYRLDGIGDDYVTALSFFTEPSNIPDGGDVLNFFDRWNGRYSAFANPETLEGVLGTSSYVSQVLSSLEDVQNEINTNTEKAWSFLQECIDTYYFDQEFNSIYNVLDKSYRNNYEGSLYN